MKERPKKSECSAVRIIRLLARHRNVLVTTTRVELAKRYSGSYLGLAWVALYPALLLGIYLFVYLVIFKMRFPGYSEMDYVLYVFAGLVPFIGFAEAVGSGTLSIKQNIHLAKNVILPLELIPVRTIAVSMPSQVVSLAVVLLLAGIRGEASWKLVLLAPAILLQLLFLMGLVFILAPLAVALPDVAYFVNLSLMLLMFISPIGFKPDMVPARLFFMVYLNPIHYMTDFFRSALLASHPLGVLSPVVFCLISGLLFAAGSHFLRRTRGFLLDYE